MKKINCLVVDDEELARTLIQSYIDKLNFLTLAGAAENATEAMGILRAEQIDVVFLDIQMPDIKGTDFARMISPATKIIFTTAYSEYALDGFELNALDYLLKPITFERFLIAVNKIQGVEQSGDIDQTITIKSGYDLHKLNFDEILYVVSDGEYVVFHTNTQKVMSHMALKSLEEKLPSDLFMRVHRSYIVQKNKVNALKGKELYIQEHRIPVSATYYEAAKKELF